MTINRINFKSSLLTQMQLAKPVTLNQVVAQPQQPAKAKQVNKTLIASGVVSGLLLILGIIKRKSITTFFKKLLNKTNKINEEIKPTTQNISKTLEEKLKIIPKPNFTCTKESDPKLYKKECKKYADSLIPYVQSEDDDICLAAMELLGKYGFTEKHLEELAGFAGTNEKNPRIIRTFVTAVADMGCAKHSGFIANFLERTGPRTNIYIYDNETLKTIISGLDRIGNVEEIEILKKYLNHDDAEIRELAQKAIESISARGTYRGFKAWV